MTRQPAVAGQFYPTDPDKLRSTINDCTPDIVNRESALGALVPHAGYVFSGPTAGAVLGRIEIPDTVVVLNPSHNVRSPACALWTGGSWKTPLGEAELNEKLCDELSALSVVSADDRAHRGEHSGEVVIPFLQYHRPDVRICVICVTTGAGPAQIRDLGSGIAEALDTCGLDNALVVASSDMSHESGPNALDVVKDHDPMAIEKMEELDPKGLIDTCRQERITMCGVLPAAAMMVSVQERGGTEGELITTATSADSPHGSGNYVVGYAGMIFR
ncbi:MAG: AmmeMemoRadiSam system protein B [Planctomycetota bacterium]